jgi:hypothetical protein
MKNERVDASTQFLKDVSARGNKPECSCIEYEITAAHFSTFTVQYQTCAINNE